MNLSKLPDITLPELAAGEHYAGIVLKDGRPAHHLVLLPGTAEAVTWKQAGEWAKKQGGELPTRREQSLLFANCREHIEGDWYWSSEPLADDSSYAWIQGFGTGDQDYDREGLQLRARAVRRVILP